MAVVPAVPQGPAPVEAERSWQQVVFLPWYPEIDDEDLAKLCALVAEAGTNPAELTELTSLSRPRNTNPDQPHCNQ